MTSHPVELVVDDDLRRTRATVFFRLLLAIPHYVWFFLWTLGAIVAVVLAWFAALASGRLPAGLHGFLARYVRYTTHLSAYLWLVADAYPPFSGAAAYPIDVRLPEPAPQSRSLTLYRLPLAIPALLLMGAISGGTGYVATRGGNTVERYSVGGGLLTAVAVLGWFASLVRGEMPRGLRDAGAYGIGYRAQTMAYFLLLTDTYPNSDPTAMLAGLGRPPLHPVRLVGEAHDLQRSRWLVLFRLPLAIPPFVWLILWGIVSFFAAILQWFATLYSGRPSPGLHRFLSGYVRYSFRVSAFFLLTADPFPGYSGKPGGYPIDIELPGPEPQNRWKTGFRVFLYLPAALVSSALNSVAFVAAVLIWFSALARGSAPWGLRNLSAYAIRYAGQANAYLYLVTDVYPNASPLEGEAPAADVVPA